jgi:hypothetical protein
MICNKRDTLLEHYRHLVERLGESVMGLKTGQLAATFARLYEESEQIRRECEKALQMLESYRFEHRC